MVNENPAQFLPRDAMLARYMLSLCVCLSVRLSVCLSVCLSQTGIVSKQVEESRLFLAWSLLSTYSTP